MSALARKLALAATSLLLAASAFGATVGNTSVDDVTLDGNNSDAFVFMDGWNPHAGPNGDTSGFGTTFDSYGSGPWLLLDKYDLNSGFANLGVLQFGFAMTNGTSGTWSVVNTGAVAMTLDLVYAMHAGGGGAAFLFDDQTINAGQTLNGTWLVDWYNGGGVHPDFSNLTLFAREVSAVPEPGQYGMLLAGLGIVGCIARRRAQR